MADKALLIGNLVKSAALRTPDKIAVILDGQTLTFAQAATEAEGLAQALLGAGVGHGDRVVWRGDTCLEVIPLFFAVAMIGAIFVPINPRATDEEAQRVIAHAEPAIALGDKASGYEQLSWLRRHAKGDALFPAIDQHDPQVVFYTSGSTGEPKGCMLSHYVQRIRLQGIPPYVGGSQVCMYPQFHMAGWGPILQAWAASGEVTYVHRADADLLMRAVSERKVETLYCIPAVWKRILEADRGGYDLSSLRQVNTGTSAASRNLLDDLRRVFPGTTTSISYGSTEAGLICLAGPRDTIDRPEWVGRPAPGVIIELSEQGEILVRQSPMLFDGYFRNDAATEAAFADGCFHTGDLAERDDDGFYRIVGRASDLIRTGGETVAPVEVEGALLDFPGVADLAIAGVPDHDWGEVITAFVVPLPGQAITLEDLRAHCQSRLAKHKHPRRIVIMDVLPRTGATRQIQRKLLVRHARELEAA